MSHLVSVFQLVDGAWLSKYIDKSTRSYEDGKLMEEYLLVQPITYFFERRYAAFPIFTDSECPGCALALKAQHANLERIVPFLQETAATRGSENTSYILMPVPATKRNNAIVLKIPIDSLTGLGFVKQKTVSDEELHAIVSRHQACYYLHECPNDDNDAKFVTTDI